MSGGRWSVLAALTVAVVAGVGGCDASPRVSQPPKASPSAPSQTFTGAQYPPADNVCGLLPGQTAAQYVATPIDHDGVVAGAGAYTRGKPVHTIAPTMGGDPNVGGDNYWDGTCAWSTRWDHQPPHNAGTLVVRMLWYLPKANGGSPFQSAHDMYHFYQSDEDLGDARRHVGVSSNNSLLPGVDESDSVVWSHAANPSDAWAIVHGSHGQMSVRRGNLLMHLDYDRGAISPDQMAVTIRLLAQELLDRAIGHQG